MRVFLKDISKNDLDLLSKYPIQGVVFSITENNIENIREVIERIPFYVSVIGQCSPRPKYALEEIIYFCKLNSIIITDQNVNEKLSCHKIIFTGSYDWNVLLTENNAMKSKEISLSQIFSGEFSPEVIALNKEEFLENWSTLVKFWAKA